MKLKFTPATKSGKPITKNIGLRLELKNPLLAPKPAAIDPSTGNPKATQINGGVLNGRAKKLPKPDYPPEAHANGESGAVSVRVLIDETGKVIRAGVISGGPHLQFAAREAACGAEFSSMRLKEDRVKISGVLTYNFVP